MALLEFRAQADAAAVLRDFHRNGQEGKQVNYLSPKIHNELTDCQQSSALASASGRTRIKNNDVFVHPPSLFSCVSLPTQRNSTH